jgi:hypothetical protein
MTVLFGLTVFLSAGLLFLIQPMIGKMLLPLLGGTPSAWNTCLVFFQAAVLAGYAYAHAVTTWVRPRLQLVMHLTVALVALVTLPPRLDGGTATFSVVESPIRWLLVRLPIAVGLPLVALSATAPLVQRWLSRTSHPSGGDPYRLYAASNLGSLVALVSYPVLVEPALHLAEQQRVWTAAYAAVVVLVAVCGVWGARSVSSGGVTEPPRAVPRIGVGRRLRWLVLAFVPSSYLLGVTAFITTDVAALPLLWVVPLILYLVSFVVVFAPTPFMSHRRVGRVLPALVLFVMLIHVSRMTVPLWLLLPLHLGAFFAAAVACHGELAADRPDASHLTGYYLLLSAGGMAGGVVNALLAPVLFDRVVEYPLAMILACLLRPAAAAEVGAAAPASRVARSLDLVLPLALAVLTAALVLTAPGLAPRGEVARIAWMFGPPAILCYTLVDRPVRFALGLVALLVAAELYPGPQGRPLHEERTFFGVVRVTTDAAGHFHQLVHGGTIHGRQHRRGTARDEPLSYYHPLGPAGDVFQAFRTTAVPRTVGVVGLGAGSLCGYAHQGDEWVFYEIDPAVERVARDPAYFTFWRDCRAERRSVVRGDARLRLAASADRRYGLLVVDAFGSDAIPVHLVTREALEVYRQKLVPSGWLVFHISSRYVDLRPVLARLAADAGFVAYGRDDLLLTPHDRQLGRDPSRWLVMAGPGSDLSTLSVRPGWRRLVAEPRLRLWTDDFSDVWSVITWE